MSSDELLQAFVRRLTRMVCKDPLQTVIVDKLAENGAYVRVLPGLQQRDTSFGN
jgi:hypothetical protein